MTGSGADTLLVEFTRDLADPLAFGVGIQVARGLKVRVCGHEERCCRRWHTGSGSPVNGGGAPHRGNGAAKLSLIQPFAVPDGHDKARNWLPQE